MTKVLYVEDNDDNVFMLKMRLELLGDFEVVTAEDGEKGCALAISGAPRYNSDGPRNAYTRRLGGHATAQG
jgi:CheY-like chemotaxis protein